MAAPRRHALVVAYDFPPHAAIGTMRTLRVVRRLVEEDWDVTVLTGDACTFRPGTPVEGALLERVPSCVRVLRARTWRGFDTLKGVVKRSLKEHSLPREARMAGPARGTAHSGRSRAGRAIDVIDAALAIPDHESGWLMPAVATGLTACWSRRPDVLYSSAPPWTGQLVAGTLARLMRCPWVADFRDPWSRAPWREDRFRFAMRAAAFLERRVVRGADHIIFVARGNRDDFAASYGPRIASKFHVVSNGCDPAEFDTRERPGAVESDRFVLLHAGSLYAGRTPVPLLRAVAAAIQRGLIDRDRFRLRFLGTVAIQSTDLVAARRSLGLEDVVEFLPRVPRDESLRAMMAASALLLLQPGHTVSVPGKLYEYLAAGRPILAIAEEGEVAEIVRQSGGGISVPPADENAMVAMLQTLLERVRAGSGPVRRELFDGTTRATETAAILAAVASGEPVPGAEARIGVQGHHGARMNSSVEREVTTI